MSSIQNPYNNVGDYPPDPFGSVVDKPSLMETAGLTVFNFVDLGNELNSFNDVQKIQSSAFPPNRTNEFNVDVTNKYFPKIQPLYNQGAASNYHMLNNPFSKTQNLELSSQRTYIKPYYSTSEVYGNVLPIEAQKSILPLGPVYVEKTILSPT